MSELRDAEATPVGRTPYFTVIIPTYNRPGLLHEAVASVTAQTDGDWELIVVDDCSPTPVTSFDDPRVRVLRNPVNSGKSASLNRALESAAGRVVLVLDDDDAWGPCRLEHCREAHKLAPVAVCGGAVLQPGHGAVPRQLAPVSAQSWTWRTPIPSGAALSVDRLLVPPFNVDLRACEDVDWVMRLRQRSPSIAVIDSVDFLWRVHAGPRHLNGIEARIEGRLRVLDLHGDYLAANPGEHAAHLRQLGYLYLRAGDRKRALGLARRSLLRRPNVGAVRLGVRALLPKSATWATPGAVLRRVTGAQRGTDVAPVPGEPHAGGV